MKKLLVLCPSRGRPYRIMEMIKSFEDTINPFHTELIVLLDKDDDSLGIYEEKLPVWVRTEIYDRTGDKTLTTEILNRAFEKHNDYEFYSVTNDDICYLTKGWDEALCQKLKISCGQDDTMLEKYGKDFIANVEPATFPITSVIDGDMCRAVGWIQYPELIHSAGDNIWYWIGRRGNCLYVDRKYHTVHNSAYFGRGEADETFKRCNAMDNKKDYYTYIEWLKYKSGNEICKIESLIKGDLICQKDCQEASA